MAQQKFLKFVFHKIYQISNLLKYNTPSPKLHQGEPNHIEDRIEEIPNNSNQKKYLSELIDNIEKQKEENNSLPFKIISIKNKGFAVKVAGLYAYISFNHMPWQYKNNIAWKAIFPFITGKVFFCKVFRIEKDPIFILINAEIPQFQKAEINCIEKYKGVVINKTRFGIFADIGYSFKWKCGSLVGLLHKSNFNDIEEYDKIEIGQIIESFFLGYFEENQMILGNNPEMKVWYSGELDYYIGKDVQVKVIKTDTEKNAFKVEGKYPATLSLTSLNYPENKTQIKQAIKNLNNDEIIHCKVLGVNKKLRLFHLKWEMKLEIETSCSRGKQIKELIGNTEDRKTSKQKTTNQAIGQKLEMIGKTVKVSVVKREDKYRRKKNIYLVENKYKGELNSVNEYYKISKKELKQAERNLSDGETIECEVIGLRNHVLILKWNLKDIDFFNFKF
jgi:hypothetical protein